jgi:ABC-2 type transport system ATP-binding protein
MIRVSNISKHYRVHLRPAGLVNAMKSLFHREYTWVKAVDGIDFEIPTGARVGFLGPNGAGKTTTLKMLSGLLHPTQGTLEVEGFVPQKRQVEFLKTIMLVMGQKQQLIWDLPPAETFELNRAIYEVPRDVFKKRMDELTELLQLESLVKKPTRQLSLGERMKCELAAALVHGPKVLFLDEPTIGLDVSMQVALRDFIKRYNEEYGATLLLTSHDMDDVAALCPRVIIIDKGKLSFDGNLNDLVKKVRPEKRITLRFSKNVERKDVEAFGRVVKFESAQVVLNVRPDEVNQVVSQALLKLPVLDMNVENPPLEEVMSELFQSSAEQRTPQQSVAV